MNPSSETVSGPVDGRTTRWTGHRERRRTEFVDAALRAVGQHGAQPSTEQIANCAGVTRTKLYRYFDDAADLRRSVARRVSEIIITDQQPVWQTIGTPMEMVIAGVSAHLRLRIDNPNLYEYLVRHSMSDDENGVSAIREVHSVIAGNVSTLIAAYLTAFGVDERPAEPLGFGIAGFVESAATHWLETPDSLSEDEFTAQLAGWIWLLLDNMLQASGVHLDPHQPLDALPG
jgi:AcrR family transcriptional regulator